MDHEQQATTPTTTTPVAKRRRGAHLLSTILFAAALCFAAVAIWFYVDDRRNQPGERTPPTAQPGQHNLVSVVSALEEAGVEAEIGRGTTASTDQLPGQRGQLVEVGDQELYVFIYTDPDTGVQDRQAASEGIDPATLSLSTRAGQPLAAGEELHVAAGSNVIAVLAGGDDELVAQVRDAIENLP